VIKVRWPLHLLRGALGVRHDDHVRLRPEALSLAETYSLFFVAPLLITVLSVFILKEKVDFARWWPSPSACWACSWRCAGRHGLLLAGRPGRAGFGRLLRHFRRHGRILAARMPAKA
jgi:hypothetical protein